MALARCILGKFLGVGCHCFPPSSPLDPNILFNTLFSNKLSLRSSLNVSDQLSHPYKTTGKIIVLYILNNTNTEPFFPHLLPGRRITLLANSVDPHDIRGLHSCPVHRTPCISPGETASYKQHNLRNRQDLSTSERRQHVECTIHDPCFIRIYTKMVSTNAHNIYIVHSVHYG